MEIREIDSRLRNDVRRFIAENWGSPVMVTKGKIHAVDELPGFAVVIDGHINALVTYHIDHDGCEIVSLDSLLENCGIGSSLVEKVLQCAKEEGCARVWLITTNDNTRAIRFYQKRGFNMIALYVNAVSEARKIKPEIPMCGNDNIPLLHEIEFERVL